MTRNNLDEHLRWLLRSQPSRIRDSPPFGPLSDAESNNVRQDDQHIEDFDMDFDDIEMEQLSPDASPRVQQTSERNNVTSPGFTARSPERQRSAARHQTSARATSVIHQTSERATSIIHQTPLRSRGLHMAEVDCIDISGDNDEPVITSRARQTNSRKRTSEEFEDLDSRNTRFKHNDDTSTTSKSTNKPARSERLPTGSPPPYSTIPPPFQSKLQSIKSSPTKSIRREIPDDDGIFDFSNQRLDNVALSKQLSSRLPTDAISSLSGALCDIHNTPPRSKTKSKHQSPTKQPVKQEHHSLSISSSSISDAIPSTARANDLDTLKAFFELSPTNTDKVRAHVTEQHNEVSKQVTEMLDEDPDNDLFTELFNQVGEFKDSLKAIDNLVARKSKMQTLMAKRDEQKTNLHNVVKQFDPPALIEAKAANAAAKAELGAFESECLSLLDACGKHIEAAIQLIKGKAKMAVQPSSRPVSPARIKQTQAQPFENGRQPRHAFDDELDDDDFSNLAADVEKDFSFAKPALPPPRTALRETSPNIVGPSNSRQVASKEGSQLADLFSHPWSEDVKVVLKEQFKLKGFRQGQLEAINTTLSGQDVFVLMPTGGGKSLCYQLPSQINSGKTRGVTVVISPLLSLMEDQVEHLRKLDIQAFLLNGNTNKAERQNVMDKLKRTDAASFVQILYITPEMLSMSGAIGSCLDTMYSRNTFGRLVIDEAHCVSQWGHDFRPDYKQIGDIRRKFPKVPIMALTATATNNVKADTMHNLGIKGCRVITRSFNRPNLYYEIRDKGSANQVLENIANLIKSKHRRETGIIYCFSRQNCEDVAQDLGKLGINADYYHAKIDAKKKSSVQQAWQAGRINVIVATTAFGMGIDKSNVRFVIHHSMPKTLEGYYQETGRAGRDGQPSKCYLYHASKDFMKLLGMINRDKDADAAVKQRQIGMLRQMQQYCDNKADCRRVQVLRYFSEDFKQQDCQNRCDVCTSDHKFTMQDVSELAQHALNIVRGFEGQEVTIPMCVDALRGSKSKKHDASDMPSYGLGKELDKDDATRLFYTLLTQGGIEEYEVNHHSRWPTTYIRSGPNADRIRRVELAMIDDTDTSRPSKGKRAKKTLGDLPLSTNVSSPIPPPSRKTMSKKALQQFQYKPQEPPNDDWLEVDDTDGDFEHGNARSGPITTDSALDKLNDVHQDMVHQFMDTAHDMARDMTDQQGLRSTVFSDTVLREMLIRWTTDKTQMQLIPGINWRYVEDYGGPFCDLVKQYRQSYDDMMQPNTAGTAINPNANVIDLCTDDEGNPEDDGDDYGSFDDADMEDDIGSSAQRDVDAFNAAFLNSQSAALRTRPSAPKSKASRKKPNYRAVSGGETQRARSKAPHGGRHSNSAVSKKTGSRRSNDGHGRGKAVKTSFINAMPT